MLTRLSLTDGVVDTVRIATDKQIIVGRPPATPDPAEPYVIVYPLAHPRLFGTLGLPDGQATIPYQFTCVGYDFRQAQWMADAVKLALLTRDTRGQFTTPITVDGMTVIDRRLTQGGGPEPGGGGLWQVADTYDLEVSV